MIGSCWGRSLAGLKVVPKGSKFNNAKINACSKSEQDVSAKEGLQEKR